MDCVKLSEMRTNDDVIAAQLRTNPEFRAKWVRSALARAVAVAIVRYRAEHDLSQRGLAERLGMKQPQVARLELGEVSPSMETLMRISSRLSIEFTIDVRPAGTPAHNVTKRSQTGDVVGSFRTEGAELLVVARGSRIIQRSNGRGPALAKLALEDRSGTPSVDAHAHAETTSGTAARAESNGAPDLRSEEGGAAAGG